MGLAQEVAHRIHDFFADWAGAGRNGSFRDFVQRADKDLVDVIGMKPEIVDSFRPEVRQAFGLTEPTPPKTRRLPERDLLPYMGEIGAAYMATAQTGDSLEAFIDRLRCECPTEEALRERLRGERRPG